MLIVYEKNMHHSYMVLENISETADCYQEQMLIHNRIPGLLPLEIRYFNDKKSYYYNITGVYSLMTVFERKKPCRKRVHVLLKQIFECIEKIKNYLLEENDIVLIPEQIFFDVENEQVYLCYCVGYGQDINMQISSLLEFFMNKIEYEEKDAVMLVYSVYMKSKEEDCKIDDLLRIVSEVEKPATSEKSCESQDLDSVISMEEKIETEYESMYYPAKSYVTSGGTLLGSLFLAIMVFRTELLYMPFGSKIDQTKAGVFVVMILAGNLFVIYQMFKKEAMQSRIKTEVAYGAFEEKMEADVEYRTYEDRKADINNDMQQTMVLSEETIVLSENVLRRDERLIPEDEVNYQVIELTGFPYFIGKLAHNTNGCIKSPVISKIHAKIIKEDEKYYIYDLNSTNGTYVNGTRLSINGFIEIRDYDRITFADISYIFSCPSKSDMIQLS